MHPSRIAALAALACTALPTPSRDGKGLVHQVISQASLARIAHDLGPPLRGDPASPWRGAVHANERWATSVAVSGVEGGGIDRTLGQCQLWAHLR